MPSLAIYAAVGIILGLLTLIFDSCLSVWMADPSRRGDVRRNLFAATSKKVALPVWVSLAKDGLGLHYRVGSLAPDKQK